MPTSIILLVKQMKNWTRDSGHIVYFNNNRSEQINANEAHFSRFICSLRS